MQENYVSTEIPKSIKATVMYADGKCEEIDLGVNGDISNIINGKSSSYINSIRRIRFTVVVDKYENGAVFDETYSTPYCVLGRSISSNKCVSLDGSETFEAVGDSWHLAGNDEEFYIFGIINCGDPEDEVSSDYLCELIEPNKTYINK